MNVPAGAVRYRRRPDVLWRRSLDAVVVLAPGAREPLTLGGTGPELWDLLVDARTVVDLAATLGAIHGADPMVVAADLEPVVASLAAAGAVERLEAGPTGPGPTTGAADGPVAGPG